VNGDYTRQRDLFDTFGSDFAATNLNTTGVGLTPMANPQFYNQFAAAASARKDWDSAFVALTGSIVDIIYDNTFPPPAAPNGVVYTATVRAGQWLIPALYVYGEASADQRNYAVSELNSHGYRAVAGFGSDQVALFRGEIYGGYQAELYDSASVPTADSAVFGARLQYYPTRELTLSATLDRALGVSQTATSPVAPFGSPTVVTTALLRASFTVDAQWSASVGAGYIHSDYIGNPELDNAWTAGATVSYSIAQNLSLTLDYQLIEKTSNVWAQNFVNNVITLGATYKY